MNGFIKGSCGGLLVAAALSAVLSASLMPPTAAQAADAAEGRRIAEQWCASCHVVGGQGKGPGGTDAAPALATIARDPNRGPDRLRGWLSNPHPPMPNPSLTRADIDNVVAYLNQLAHE
ncbi:c-type cytochrome [Azospirillum sp. TSO35-2]|uniref:c-type cytochrome n=1 Tax=Azospirillum sp. TSO35-2 TaxID=716796 RepID=UPI000D60B06F|nr:c-type cytochrome [Azospirillum sp. TSO35-2]PWC37834.1 hypothetical protein TSO352_10270 [Azospirillum sp. TSO35-2]